VVRGRKGEYESLLADLGRQGYTRARVDGEVVELTGVEAARPRLARYEQHTIEVVVDRLVRRPGIERRLTDSLETALRLAEGVAEVEIVPRRGGAAPAAEAEGRDAGGEGGQDQDPQEAPAGGRDEPGGRPGP
jgi:excinuclease ABC subunit A